MGKNLQDIKEQLNHASTLIMELTYELKEHSKYAQIVQRLEEIDTVVSKSLVELDDVNDDLNNIVGNFKRISWHFTQEEFEKMNPEGIDDETLPPIEEEF